MSSDEVRSDRAPQGRARARYHAGLSRDLVVTAAVALLRAEGPGVFSLRRLAADLGVDTMALYKHVQNKDDLTGAALARIFVDARPAGRGEWWEQVRDTFLEHRRVIHAEPWTLELLLGHRTRSAEPWAGVDESLALLQPHLGSSGAARWMRWLAAYTNGFLLTEPGLREQVDARAVSAARPRVAAAAARNAAAGDEDFRAGLELLITAMRAEATTT